MDFYGFQWIYTDIDMVCIDVDLYWFERMLVHSCDLPRFLSFCLFDFYRLFKQRKQDIATQSLYPGEALGDVAKPQSLGLQMSRLGITR